MNENNNVKPNYNHAYYSGNHQNENGYGNPSYVPNTYEYDRGYTDSFYDEYEESGVGSFLLGALVGGVIGAATALFLAPKTGKEMRDDFSTQANQFKDRTIELSAVAKEKATEFTSVAKEKTGEMTKTLQEQSENLVDKVKSMKSKTSVPMDDGTVSSEGEEAIEFIDISAQKSNNSSNESEENVTATAEALRKAVVGKDDSKSAKANQSTKNSNVSYDNSDNDGKEKIMNQNYVSDIVDDKK